MIEAFFDLRIATVRPGEDPPPEAHLARIENPAPDVVRAYVKSGWFYKPCWVTYAIAVPESLEAYIGSAFRSVARNKPRKLLREVPRRYHLAVDERGTHVPELRRLYARTVVARPRGKDRLGELREDFSRGWLGCYLFDGLDLVAGILAQDSGDHLSIGYGAFDPEHRRALDLEHYLIMQVLQRSIDRRDRFMSLGMDTNRYGHHLSPRLPAYKLRIGFTPAAYEPGGRELLTIRSFAPFEDGLLFYSYVRRGLVLNYFARGVPDLRPYQHHTAPPILVHSIPPRAR